MAQHIMVGIIIVIRVLYDGDVRKQVRRRIPHDVHQASRLPIPNIGLARKEWQWIGAKQVEVSFNVELSQLKRVLVYNFS